MSSTSPPVPAADTQALSALLGYLGPDPDTAGRAFEDLRRGLVRFFDWRGVHVPEECADICLDRLAKRILEGEQVVSVPAFTFALARLVLLEYGRRPDTRTVSLDDAPESVLAVAASRSSPWLDCLEAELAALPAAGRELILRYYTRERRAKIDDRAALARELGITVAALRNRAQRLRDRLERAVSACVATSQST